MLNEFKKIIFGKELPVPSELPRDSIHLTGDENKLDKIDYVTFHCPCGCDVTLNIPVHKNSKRSWKILSHNTVTLSPSVRIIDKCESHFFIEKNKVKWC